MRKTPKGVIILAFFIVALMASSIRLQTPSTSVSQPILATEEAVFSQDAEVVGTADAGIVYAVEYRGNPNYRITSLDTKTGELNEVFNVPKGSIVYSIALSPDKNKLAIGYSDNMDAGNGVFLIDLSGKIPELTQVIPAKSGINYLDLAWSNDGKTIWSTYGDTTTDEIVYSVAKIDVESRAFEIIVTDAIDPVPTKKGIAYLPLEPDQSRRSIEVIDLSDGSKLSVAVSDKKYDLDTLMYDQYSDSLLVNALNKPSSVTLRLGGAAYAHGSHDVPSSILILDGVDYGNISANDLDPKVTFESSLSTDGVLVEATNEGLYVTNGNSERTFILKSRALRYVTN
jgi:hypothetical protein